MRRLDFVDSLRGLAALYVVVLFVESQALRRVVASAVALIFLFTVLFLLFYRSSANTDIITDWNNTISLLGIEPVFPPEARKDNQAVMCVSDRLARSADAHQCRGQTSWDVVVLLA
jgi:hypothetical protein